ncbi:hypothetical protein F511_41880 [Dorcoceras hygrometricum]|uniref:Uncharacterized protein n=1 Tax=Dorcoceras hygrometricum TaxID=472368 RepID=A0A2Z7CPZ6_9LAMI|nr:hypothetical protein F511_41880 [Dorcoceras hygrometricum]
MAVYCLLSICVYASCFIDVHTRIVHALFQIPRVLYFAASYLVYCCCFLSGCEGERQYRTLISLLGLLATMRRVVNYHSSWARQRSFGAMFEFLGSLFGCSLQLLSRNLGFTAGRGFNPAGGAPGGGQNRKFYPLFDSFRVCVYDFTLLRARGLTAKARIDDDFEGEIRGEEVNMEKVKLASLYFVSVSLGSRRKTKTQEVDP